MLRSFISGNTCFEYSVKCICSVGWVSNGYLSMFGRFVVQRSVWKHFLQHNSTWVINIAPTVLYCMNKTLSGNYIFNWTHVFIPFLEYLKCPTLEPGSMWQKANGRKMAEGPLLGSKLRNQMPIPPPPHPTTLYHWYYAPCTTNRAITDRDLFLSYYMYILYCI